MAEGFANCYGSDVLRAESRGLSPVSSIVGDTIETMLEKNIDVSRHIPQRFDPLEAMEYDIVVNMSGFTLPGPKLKDVRDWPVADPYGRSKAAYQTCCNDIETRVMRLILELRKR